MCLSNVHIVDFYLLTDNKKLKVQKVVGCITYPFIGNHLFIWAFGNFEPAGVG